MIPERFRFLAPILVAIILLLGIQIGYYIKGKDTDKVVMYHNGLSASTFDQVLGIVQTYYTDTVSTQKLQGKAISELLQSLDPHSVYIGASELGAVNDELEGHFSGIGIEFTLLNDTVNVVRVMPGGPSAKAGLKVGDKIVVVENHPFTGAKVGNDTVTHYLRGKMDSEVKLKIKRNTQLLDVTLKRGQITNSSIYASYMMTPKVGYIGVREFTTGVSVDFVRALDSLKKQGMKQLVIDLRGNPGGLLDEAAKICDEFLDENKLIVYTQGRAYPKKEYKCKTQGDFEDGKVVILVDETSASASEIVAGAMQDWERATIIGRRTFGKGLVQEQFNLNNGGAMRLTIARYYTPSGRCIQRSYAKGIEAYYHDISQRMLHTVSKGDSTANSDTTHYYTLLSHKPVFAGGGITPDITVETDTTAYTTEPGVNAETIRQAAFILYTRHNTMNKYKDLDALLNDAGLKSELYNTLNIYLSQKHIKLSAQPINSRINNRLLANYARLVFNDNAYYAVLNSADAVCIKTLTVLNK